MTTQAVVIARSERIHLRKLTPDDVNETCLGWLNDPGVNQYLESRFASHTLESIRAYVDRIARDAAYVFAAIVLNGSNRHIGNIKLGPIDPHHRLGDIGLLIGDPACWGKGYATEAIKLLADFAFTSLKLHKLTAGAYGGNPGSVKAFLKAGFTQEASLPGHYLSEGRWVDRVCLGLINPLER